MSCLSLHIDVKELHVKRDFEDGVGEVGEGPAVDLNEVTLALKYAALWHLMDCHHFFSFTLRNKTVVALRATCHSVHKMVLWLCSQAGWSLF